MRVLHFLAFLLYAGYSNTAEINRCRVTFDIATRRYNNTPLPLLHPAVFPNVKNVGTIININGWKHNSSGPGSYYPDITREYLKKGDYNIILVHANSYMFASKNVSASYVGSIGAYVADIVIQLHISNNLSLNNVHIIGHGLGAHIAGVVGSTIKMQLNATIARITALEVSVVGFENVTASERLDRTDARLVDVIHTDAGEYGVNESVGTIDFWPNRGIPTRQDCEITSPVRRAYCSFDKSVWYFIYTINNIQEAAGCLKPEEGVIGDGNCLVIYRVPFGANFYEYRLTGNAYINIVCRNRVCQSDYWDSLLHYNTTTCYS